MNTPLFLDVIFGLTCLLTVLLFLKASHLSKPIGLAILAIIILQSVLAGSGFYLNLDSKPPRMMFLVGPSIALILVLLFHPKGRLMTAEFSLKYLTILHMVRIPVEVVLYYLFVYKAVPELMTFEGRNFDILSGLSAPIIYYLYFIKKNISKKVLLFWNLACLALLLNIVVNAILSIPSPIQQFGFNQPNLAVLHSPFNLLPSVIVPLVLLSHLVTIKQLSKHETPSI